MSRQLLPFVARAPGGTSSAPRQSVGLSAHPRLTSKVDRPSQPRTSPDRYPGNLSCSFVVGRPGLDPGTMESNKWDI
jgi:hypothetical protein